jgi:uncharacterized membrane protein
MRKNGLSEFFGSLLAGICPWLIHRPFDFWEGAFISKAQFGFFLTGFNGSEKLAYIESVMSIITFCGIFSLGFVFGYLLYYAVRHTKEFNMDLLASAIGTIGGGVVVGLFGKTEAWIGPYGLGVGSGFIFYLVLSLFLIFSGKFHNVADNKVMLLSKTILGSPRQE